MKRGNGDEVGILKRWFTTQDFDGFRQNDVPTSGFCSSAKNLWQTIKKNERLDIPAFKVLVANLECKKIKDELVEELSNDKSFEQSITPEEFNQQLESIIKSRLSRYDIKVGTFYDKNVTATVRQDLTKELYLVLENTCRKVLNKLRLDLLKENEGTITIELNKEEHPSSSIDTQVHFCLKKFDGNSEGLNLNFSSVVTEVRLELKSNLTSMAATIANKIEDDRCHDFLKKLCSEIENSSNGDILSKLQQEPNPQDIVGKLVDSYMAAFDESSKGLNSRYAPLCDDSRTALRRRLTEYAKISTKKIEAQRAAIEAEKKAEVASQRELEAENARIVTQRQMEEAKKELEKANIEKERAEAEASRRKEEAEAAELAREKAQREAEHAREIAEKAAKEAKSEEDKRQAEYLKMMADQAEAVQKLNEQNAEHHKKLAKMAEQVRDRATKNTRTLGDFVISLAEIIANPLAGILKSKT